MIEAPDGIILESDEIMINIQVVGLAVPLRL